MREKGDEKECHAELSGAQMDAGVGGYVAF